MAAEKTCSGCKKIKPLDEFPRDSNGKYGCHCCPCAVQYTRKWRREHYRVEKRCPRCEKTKPIGEFPERKNRRDGRGGYCRQCYNERMAEWRRKNPEKRRENRRKRQLKSKYNITPTDYNNLLQSQHGACAVCSQPCPTGNHLAVDHDHKTGRVRGLLCVNCNMTLGYVQDDPDLLRELADYLEEHTQGGTGMTKFKKWAVAIIIIAILASIGLVALYNSPQVRQTLCTLRCQRIEDDAAWEACIGECLVEMANDSRP